MPLASAIIGLAGSVFSIFGSSSSQSKQKYYEQRAQYFYEQRILLGKQYLEYSNYLNTLRYSSIIKTFVLPFIALFLILYYLYKK